MQMTKDAIENYGEQWRGVELLVTHTATKYMPAKEFYSKGMPSGYHPGYDEAMKGMKLYDLKRKDTGEELPFSLYSYELRN